MRESQRVPALAAASSIATGWGLEVGGSVVLQDSNKLTVRLLPCDVVARVAPASDPVLEFEVDVARQLTAAGSPVAGPDPRIPARVHESGGFRVSFWTYYPSHVEPLSPAAYARALIDLHAGLRRVDLTVPHVTDRVARARVLLGDRERTPELPEVDRGFLIGVLDQPLGRGAEQVLHGEPHEGNVLATADGPRFIDLETCCRGPLEFDLAHAPDEVADHYPGLDADLLRDCRRLVLALVVTWRWDRDDRFPDGRAAGREWLAQLRAFG